MSFFTPVFRPGLLEIMSLLLRLKTARKKISKNTFRIRIFLFMTCSFGTVMINTFIHSRSSLETHTRFQTKMGKVQTKTTPKPYPWGRHILIWLIWGYPPPPGILAENNLLFELTVVHSSFSRDLFHPRGDFILFRFIPDRPDSTSPDPIRCVRVKQRLTITSNSLQVHKRNAIKLGLKSPLKVGQERKKVHVTGINEATFVWPENLRLFFLNINSRSNYKVYKLPLLEGAITDLAVKWNVTGL